MIPWWVLIPAFIAGIIVGAGVGVILVEVTRAVLQARVKSCLDDGPHQG